MGYHGRTGMNKRVYKLKKNNGHSKKGIIAFYTSQIGNLMDNGNFALAAKLIGEAEVNYPDDELLIKCKIRYLILNKRYEEALQICEELPEEYVKVHKMVIYMHLNDYENIKDLYDKYFYDDYTEEEEIKYYDVLRYYAMGLQGYEIPEEEFNQLSYGQKQAYAYSEDRAIKHIKMRHFDGNGEDYENFDSKVDFNYIYAFISEYIKVHPEEAQIINGGYNYLFYYPDAGISIDGVKENYISVFTTLTDNKILSMYPSVEREHLRAIKFTENIKEDTKESNMDKFIKKHGYR